MFISLPCCASVCHHQEIGSYIIQGQIARKRAVVVWKSPCRQNSGRMGGLMVGRRRILLPNASGLHGGRTTCWLQHYLLVDGCGGYEESDRQRGCSSLLISGRSYHRCNLPQGRTRSDGDSRKMVPTRQARPIACNSRGQSRMDLGGASGRQRLKTNVASSSGCFCSPGYQRRIA